MQVSLLREIRYISNEVGYREARKMPIYERRWWIEQMQKEAEQRADPSLGKRTMDIK